MSRATSGSPAAPELSHVSESQAMKACCSAAYGNDLVHLLLGESFHPGGRELTRHLAGLLKVASGTRVLDVASGPGTTAQLLAEEFGARVLGIDISTDLVARASAAAAQKGTLGVTFQQADAEELDLPQGEFDLVICECALSTFPAKARALACLHRVLKPGGRLGLTDVSLDAAFLDDSLKTLAGHAACIGGALRVDQYKQLLAGAGFCITHDEAHDAALVSLLDSVEARIKALRILGKFGNQALSIDPGRILELIAAARGAVDNGIAGYHLFIAERL